ncbi:HAD family hydrolase [Nocardioides sp. CFH 31398]|uniref:HAD family hydrolase n=1 Tax=Nocardioides sp. CFH 31398 TaxID=2919579 RepID=UPI001F06C39A|nr:HAD family hydrolase [Nocardioides sp. CFH 31398]MCH1866885.1 HAD family hydrolase [Nocardioides sp. CFH 31398]
MGRAERPVRAVLLDLDDTLVDHAGAARAAVLAFVRHHGRDGDPEQHVERWRALTDEWYPRYQRREVTLDEHRRARVRAFLDASGLTDAEADDRFADYQRSYRSQWRAFDDAAPLLRRLRDAGLPTGVLTNGEQGIQTEKLRRTGLLDLVDVVAASSGLPAAKPDPRAFGATAALLGVAVEDALMVGDSWENDVRGALEAGAAAVLLDRRAARTGTVRDGVDVVRSLDDVAAGTQPRTPAPSRISRTPNSANSAAAP